MTVTLSEISGLDVSVQYNTIAGTATSDDNDFAPVIDTLTILAGQLSGTITIDVTADAKFEPDEYFWVRISSPTNADIGQDVAKVTVLNDDDPPFVLTIADVTVNEADGSVDLTVTRMDFAETAAVTAISGTSFMYTTADLSAEAGLDYQGMTGAVGTIPAAQTSVIITIGILQDAIYEGTENFEVTLHDPTEGAISSANGKATVEITEDDPLPAISILDRTVSEGDGIAMVTIEQDRLSTMDSSVTVSTQDGSAKSPSDYKQTTTDATIPAGSLSIMVAVEIVDDTLDEPNEVFSVAASAPVNATLDKALATVTIQDNDGAPSVVAQTTAFVVEGDSPNKTNVEIMVSLTQSSSLPISVKYDTVDGTPSFDGPVTAFVAALSGANEVPPATDVTVKGTGVFMLNAAETELFFHVTIDELVTPIVSGHFH